MSDSNEIKQAVPSLKLGEIFSYEIENDGDIDKVEAFFLKVEKDYYVVGIDSDDRTFSFFDSIAGLKYKGKERDGKFPFTYKEALEYLKARSVKPTGRMVVEPKPKAKTSKENFLLMKTKQKSSWKESYNTSWYNGDVEEN